jgi:hypothetical protein
MALRWWRARRGDDELPGGRGIPASGDGPIDGGGIGSGRRAARRRDRPAPPELVQVPVGFDRFVAGALAARLEAEGVPVRLLTNDEHGLSPGRSSGQQHRLLIRADDEERVRAHIDRTT